MVNYFFLSVASVSSFFIEKFNQLLNLLLLNILQAGNQLFRFWRAGWHQIPSKDKISFSQVRSRLHDILAEANQVNVISSLLLTVWCLWPGHLVRTHWTFRCRRASSSEAHLPVQLSLHADRTGSAPPRFSSCTDQSVVWPRCLQEVWRSFGCAVVG